VINPGDIATYRPTIQRVIDHFNEKIPEYERAADYYKGAIGEIFANERIAELIEDTGDDYLLNFSGKVVDAVLDRLSIQSVIVTDPQDNAITPIENSSLDFSPSGEMGDSTPVLAAGPGPEPETSPADALAADRARHAIVGHPDDSPDSPDTPPSPSQVATALNTTPAPHAAADPNTAPSTEHVDEHLQQTWVRVYKANNLANFFPKWIKKAEIYGDGYALAWDDGTPNGVLTQVLDTCTTCVLYDEENEDVVVCGARWWETTHSSKRMNLYYDHWIVKLVTKPKADGEKAEDYIPFYDPTDLPGHPDLDAEGGDPAAHDRLLELGYPYINALVPSLAGGNPPLVIAEALATSMTLETSPGQPQGRAYNTSIPGAPDAPAAHSVWPVPNPYGQQPIHHLRTDDDACYGTPEHRSSYGAQNGINKLAITLMATTDASGFPSRFGLQKSGTIDDNAFDDPDDDESPPDARQATIADEPGTINLLKDVDSVIQLAAADPENFLKPLDSLVKYMSFVTSTPMSFYDTLGQMPSDSTQRENTGPLIQKCDKRKRIMTPTLERYVTFLFQVLTRRAVSVLVQWAQSQVVNDLAGLQVITGKMSAGVPWEVAMQEAGYTEAQIASWPKPSAGFTAQVAMALQIAQAAQALAAAAAPPPGTAAAPTSTPTTDPVTGETTTPAPHQNVAPGQSVLDIQDARDMLKAMIETFRKTPIDATSQMNVSFRG
jgi:hypothetical protein